MDKGWRAQLIRAAAFGAGAVTVAIIAFASVSFYQAHQAATWDRHAIVASYSELSVSTASDGPLVDLSYAVHNSSAKDYTLPLDAGSLYVLTHKNGEMYRFKGGPDPYAVESSVENVGLIPAGHVVIVTVHLKYAYNNSYSVADKDDPAKMAPYIASRLSYVDGFTILDRLNHYEIDFPSGWNWKNQPSH